MYKRQCLSSLREKKISVPAEIKIASMYDSKNLEYNNPPITSIRFEDVYKRQIME